MSKLNIDTIENEILQSCTYILTKENEPDAYLIDCGDVAPIMSYLNKMGKNLGGILLTHCHYDHIYGLKELLYSYPNLRIFASEATFRGLEDDNLNMSYLYSDDEYIVEIDEEQRVIAREKNGFKVLSEMVDSIPTPGHDVDCMTYVIGDAIFTGDSYNPNSPVFTKWRNSNVDLAIKNEKLLKEMIDVKHLVVYPGHRID